MEYVYIWVKSYWSRYFASTLIPSIIRTARYCRWKDARGWRWWTTLWLTQTYNPITWLGANNMLGWSFVAIIYDTSISPVIVRSISTWSNFVEKRKGDRPIWRRVDIKLGATWVLVKTCPSSGFEKVLDGSYMESISPLLGVSGWSR